jgi:acyl carrier protein
MSNETGTVNREEAIKNLLSEHLGVEYAEVKADARLVEDLGADSLDRLEIAMALEEQFDIELTDDEIEKITTVQEVIDLVLAAKDRA